jgi:hypothetical protein
VAIVLAVSEDAKTVERKELLRAVNCLKQWCKEFCSGAEINIQDCLNELSGSEVEGDDEEEWTESRGKRGLSYI